MSDSNYIKYMTRIIEILTQGRMTLSKGIIQVFLVVLFKKNAKYKISCGRKFTSVHMKLWPLNTNQNFKIKNLIALF